MFSLNISNNTSNRVDLVTLRDRIALLPESICYPAIALSVVIRKFPADTFTYQPTAHRILQITKFPSLIKLKADEKLVEDINLRSGDHNNFR